MKGSVYYILIDKYENCVGKSRGKSYAVRDALNNPQVVAVKEVEHIINEKVIWKRNTNEDVG